MQLPMFDNCPLNAAYRIARYWLEDENDDAKSALDHLTAKEARLLSDLQVEVI